MSILDFGGVMTLESIYEETSVEDYFGIYTSTGSLFKGDALRVLKTLPNNSVGLIYADPPFFTGNRFYQGNEFIFSDKWKGGVAEYTEIMTSHLREIWRVLDYEGSIYLHTDSHGSHYLKVIMDQIFGYKRFLNEIVWKRQSAHCDVKQGSRHYGRIHDTLLVYTKSSSYVWNHEYIPYSEDYIKKSYKYTENKTGRKFALGDLTAPGGFGRGNAFYDFMGTKKYWRYSKDRMNKLFLEGRIYVPKKGGIPKLKRYFDEQRGIPLQDIWTDLWSLKRDGKRIYPTQKPLSLLERIIRVSSNENTLVLDPYCGSGTTLVAAQLLGRKWIGIDNSSIAIRIAERRLKKFGASMITKM